MVSIPCCAHVALAQDRFHNAAEPTHRAAVPMLSDRGALDAVQRRNPALVETTLSREVGSHGRQQRVEIVRARLRKHHDAEAIPDWGGQRIRAVGGGDVGDLGQIEGRLQCGIRVAGIGLGLEKAEYTS
jgi:hypothetical protein